jgi:hypothetical protein
MEARRMNHRDRKRLLKDAEMARLANPRINDNRIVNAVPAINAETAILLGHVQALQGNTKAQLDILRQTRGQRVVGTLRIPPHLAVPEMLDDRSVEMRGGLSPIVTGER